jgi:putative NADH-flavin reductase
MKLIVLGATGSIGVIAVGQALDRGHSVTALVRDAEALRQFRDRIRIIRGDLLSGDDLGAAIAGHDAVLSCFGPREPIPRKDSGLLKNFAAALTAAMSNGGPRRVVVLSVAFLFSDSIIPPAYLAGRLLFPGHVRDAAHMEEIFRASGLEWTIVRPPQFTDKPHNPNYRVRDGHLPRFGFTISRGDVADFMLKAAEDRGFIGKIVGIAN